MQNEQLELDLVSPFLAEPAVCAELREEAQRYAELAEKKFRQARLQARLQHEDLVYGQITDELDQLRVLIGPIAWRKSHKLWERRARKNPRRFRKVLLDVKNFFNL